MLVTLAAFRPGAGCSSKRVTTGPGCTATTSTSTPKSRSFSSTWRDMASSPASETTCCGGLAASRSESWGSAPGVAGSSTDGSNRGTWRSFS